MDFCKVQLERESLPMKGDCVPNRGSEIMGHNVKIQMASGPNIFAVKI